jgi:hypothetical protein
LLLPRASPPLQLLGEREREELEERARARAERDQRKQEARQRWQEGKQREEEARLAALGEAERAALLAEEERRVKEGRDQKVYSRSMGSAVAEEARRKADEGRARGRVSGIQKEAVRHSARTHRRRLPAWGNKTSRGNQITLNGVKIYTEFCNCEFPEFEMIVLDVVIVLLVLPCFRTCKSNTLRLCYWTF